MPYVNGTANSPDEFREAIRSFATRTLGNFDDLFGGSLGLSAFGNSSSTVLGLRHRESDAAILFDIVDGQSMNNLSGEHVLLGQLLDRAFGAARFDANEYVGEQGSTIIRMDQVGVGIQRLPLLVPGNPDTRRFVGLSQTGIGVLSGLGLGKALVLNETHGGFDFHVYAVSNLVDVDEPTGTYTQEVEADYIGSYNENGTTSDSVVIPDNLTAVSASQSEDHLVSTFNALSTDSLANTKFNEFTTGMWGEELTATDIANGWYPRSGRLDFTAGVTYEFFGSARVGEEHFHMALQNVGGDRVSHWWTGRVANSVQPLSYSGTPYSESSFLTSSTCSTGMFLGTSGPHTDAQGVDRYQYPFSWQPANVAYQNPCSVVADYVTNESGDALPGGGGRYEYGPDGANVLPKYGPNSTVYKTLNTSAYSIQGGLNGFGGGGQVGMHGARGRTLYPLRPNRDMSLPFPVFNTGSQFTFPWAPVEATLYGLPMPEDQAGVTGASTNAYQSASDIENAPTHTGTLALNADGFAEQAQGTALDPQLHLWRASGADGLSLTTTAYDRIEFRVRLKTPAVGGTLNADGEFFYSTAEGTLFGAANGGYGQFTVPQSFYDGEWTTFLLDPQDVANVPANWYDTGTSTAKTVDGFRIDILRYSAAPTTGAVLEWDYVSLGDSRLVRDTKYMVSHGSYAIHLGQLPGVNRVTMQAPAGGGNVALRSEVNVEGDTYVSIEASLTSTSPSDLARPSDPTINSGLAGYVYKR